MNIGLEVSMIKVDNWRQDLQCEITCIHVHVIYERLKRKGQQPKSHFSLASPAKSE